MSQTPPAPSSLSMSFSLDDEEEDVVFGDSHPLSDEEVDVDLPLSSLSSLDGLRVDPFDPFLGSGVGVDSVSGVPGSTAVGPGVVGLTDSIKPVDDEVLKTEMETEISATPPPTRHSHEASPSSPPRITTAATTSATLTSGAGLGIHPKDEEDEEEEDELAAIFGELSDESDSGDDEDLMRDLGLVGERGERGGGGGGQPGGGQGGVGVGADESGIMGVMAGLGGELDHGGGGGIQEDGLGLGLGLGGDADADGSMSMTMRRQKTQAARSRSGRSRGHIFGIPSGIPDPDESLRPLIRLKMPPKLITVNPRPFEPQDDSETPLLEPFPVIRYRFALDSNGEYLLAPGRYGGGMEVPVLQSNSRILKWSDGSLQLQVGSHVFDVSETDLQKRKGGVAALPRLCYRSHSRQPRRFYLQHGPIEKQWTVGSGLARGGRRGAGGGDDGVKSNDTAILGLGLDDQHRFKRRTKLTDKVLDYDAMASEKALKYREEARRLKERQRKKLEAARRRAGRAERAAQQLVEDGDGGDLSLKQLKRAYRSRRGGGRGGRGRRVTGGKRRRASRTRKKRAGKKRAPRRKKKASARSQRRAQRSRKKGDGDEFVVSEDEEEGGEGEEGDEDSDDLEYDEDDDESEGYSEDDENDEEFLDELSLYQDDSGSDSDETYRPVSKRRKRS